MIIGKNYSFNKQTSFNSNFQKRNNKVLEESKNSSNFINRNNTMKYTNINSKKETIDKSFQILQERYHNGLITLDEFTKKCNQINKMRQK